MKIDQENMETEKELERMAEVSKERERGREEKRPEKSKLGVRPSKSATDNSKTLVVRKPSRSRSETGRRERDVHQEEGTRKERDVSSNRSKLRSASSHRSLAEVRDNVKKQATEALAKTEKGKKAVKLMEKTGELLEGAAEIIKVVKTEGWGSEGSEEMGAVGEERTMDTVWDEEEEVTELEERLDRMDINTEIEGRSRESSRRRKQGKADKSRERSRSERSRSQRSRSRGGSATGRSKSRERSSSRRERRKERENRSLERKKSQGAIPKSRNNMDNMDNMDNMLVPPRKVMTPEPNQLSWMEEMNREEGEHPRKGKQDVDRCIAELLSECCKARELREDMKKDMEEYEEEIEELKQEMEEKDNIISRHRSRKLYKNLDPQGVKEYQGIM